MGLSNCPAVGGGHVPSSGRDPVCADVPCVHTELWLPVFGNFNVSARAELMLVNAVAY